MPGLEETQHRLATIPNLKVQTRVPLAGYTRFGIGGPADIFAEASGVEAVIEARRAARDYGLPCLIMGGGTNLVVSDDGFRGLVVRYTAARLTAAGSIVAAEAGAELDALVDFTAARGLAGLETLAGVPGSVGAAIYGNAGAYGHSVSERVLRVSFLDGEQVRVFNNRQCEFHYRESIFKRFREWMILSAEFSLDAADAGELRRVASRIRAVRDEKFPPSMKCAGSIFKNLLLAELPPAIAAQVPAGVIREGKVPAAYFLEQAGAKGMARGGIRVADHHANLIYNAGGGTARDLRELIEELKCRVRGRFGVDVEEEIQYAGFG